MQELTSETLYDPIQCLDKGFVRLVDAMGNDASIVQAARVSYGAGTKKVHEDRGLIRYLLRHAHTTPFEMVEFKFHVKLPIFVARQWIRHRTANVNEYSGRYSVMKDEFYMPEAEQLKVQSATNKQGRSEDTLPSEVAADIQRRLEESSRLLYDDYENFMEQGLARELARINLPLSLYTEWYWKIDLHNLLHFLRLRLDSHAQYEIRVYGEAIASIVRHITPVAYEAFEDYILHARRFTRLDLQAISLLLGDTLDSDTAPELLAKAGLKGREAHEFLEKMQLLRSYRENL